MSDSIRYVHPRRLPYLSLAPSPSPCHRRGLSREGCDTDGSSRQPLVTKTYDRKVGLGLDIIGLRKSCG